MTPPEPNLSPANPRNFRVGEVVHHWTLLSFWRGPPYPKIMALAECACGSPPRLVQLQNIANGASTNCGCQRKATLTKHGLSYHPLYRVWQHMIQRCSDQSDDPHPRYGGRGISVCDRWLSLDNFVADMEDGFAPGLQIDRIDNDGNYEPDNCRWATCAQQNRNRSTTIYVEHEGETLTLWQWASRFGIPYQRMHKRYHAGKRGAELMDPDDRRNRGAA